MNYVFGKAVDKDRAAIVPEIIDIVLTCAYCSIML